MFGGKGICVWRAGGWRLWQGLEEADELGGEVGLEAFDGGHGGGVGGFEGALGRGEVVGLLDLAFDEDGGGEDDTIGVVVAPCGEAAARGGGDARGEGVALAAMEDIEVYPAYIIQCAIEC